MPSNQVASDLFFQCIRTDLFAKNPLIAPGFQQYIQGPLYGAALQAIHI
jgi:hypothetical protein